jgi:hypothetical protein
MSDPGYDFFGTAAPRVVADPSAAQQPAPVSRFGTPFAAPAAASAHPSPPPSSLPTPARHGGASGAPVSLPRNVRAVALLALVLGVVAALGFAIGLSQYLTLSRELDETFSAEGGLGAALGSSLLTVLMLGIVIIGAVSAFLVVGGVATLVGQRWGGWMLVAAFVVYLLGQAQDLVQRGTGEVSVLGVAIAVVLLLVLVTGDGWRWLARG